MHLWSPKIEGLSYPWLNLPQIGRGFSKLGQSIDWFAVTKGRWKEVFLGMVSCLVCSKGKATVVVPGCPEKNVLDVIDPSKGKGQQLPRFGIWHHTATRLVVARVHWQCKSGVIRFISIRLCRLMNEDYWEIQVPSLHQHNKGWNLAIWWTVALMAGGQ